MSPANSYKTSKTLLGRNRDFGRQLRFIQWKSRLIAYQVDKVFETRLRPWAVHVSNTDSLVCVAR